MKDFYTYLSTILNIDSGTIDVLSSLTNRIEINKNEFIIEPDQKIDKVFFVINGLMRSFYVDRNGKEHTLQFANKFSWISDYISLYENKNSKLFIQAVTDCVIIEFNISNIYNLCNKYSQISSLYRRGLEEHVAKLGSRVINQLQFTAEERYDMFLKAYPGVEQIATNYHIASYLGITQQSLSRIRAEKNINYHLLT